MTTFAVFGDRHYARKFARADHVLELWDWAITDAIAHGATVFINVGDACEGDPDGDERWVLGQRYSRMLAAGLVVEITGNHEAYAAHRWLEILGVKVIWNRITTIQLPGARLICCPYPRLGWPPFEAPIEDARTRAIWTIEQALELERYDEPTVFLAHATPEHATTRNTRFELHHQAEVVIPQRILTRCALSIFGHIHRPQSVWDTGLVVGSMARVDFDEAEDPKRYLLVTVEGADVRVESRPLPVRPMIELALVWAPGLTLPDVLDPGLAVGADVKITVQIPVDVAATYTPETFDPIKAQAASFMLRKTIETPEQQRRATLPPDATFAEEVADWMTTTDQPDVLREVAARLQALGPKLSELEQVRA